MRSDGAWIGELCAWIADPRAVWSVMARLAQARPGSPSRLAELHEPSSSPIHAPSDRSWLGSRRLAQARQPTCRARRAEPARQVTRRLIGPGSPNRARQPTCRARRAEQLADPRAVWSVMARLAQAPQPTYRARRAEQARQATRRLIGHASPSRARQADLPSYTSRAARRSTRRLIGHGSARPGSPRLANRLAELHEPSSSPIHAPSDLTLIRVTYSAVCAIACKTIDLQWKDTLNSSELYERVFLFVTTILKRAAFVLAKERIIKDDATHRNNYCFNIDCALRSQFRCMQLQLFCLSLIPIFFFLQEIWVRNRNLGNENM